MKYDDSYKKKEEVLRKVFFKECAKEEEKRNHPGGKGANWHTDPVYHMKIIEEIISAELFKDYNPANDPNPSGATPN